MDVHRCRFIPYPPSAINSLAFTHTSGVASRNQPLRLAIGRANGDIELWDPRKGAWIHETTFRGGRGRSVEGLCWIQDPDEEGEERGGKKFVTHGRLRLFSIGYSSAVTEWDLYTGLPLRESGGSLSEVWCIAAQPRYVAKPNETVPEEQRFQRIVAGCADGTLVLLSTADDGLTFEKYIARPTKKNARTLSLAFKDRNTLVAGFANSSIRVYDLRSGQLIRNMSLGGGPVGGPKEKLVWALDCLKDGTIVSGDSAGEVVFWDGKTYGQLQRLKGHEADILCLASSEDGNTVFSGGMDRRTVVYTAQQTQGSRKKWAETAHRRFHQHDVKAMARYDSSGMSVVVSGGLDTHPILIPLREYGNEFHHTLPYVPQTPPVTGGGGRCIVGWWNNQITIWRVARRKQHEAEKGGFMDTTSTPNHRIVAQLALSGDESIASAAMSPNGALLAVSTSAETKIFNLQPRRTGAQKGTIKIKKLDSPRTLTKSGAKIVQFSPDGRWLLLISLANTITLFRVNSTVPSTSTSADEESSPNQPHLLEEPTTLHRRHVSLRVQNWLNGPWGSYERTVTRAAFSADGRVLAVSDLGGNVDTWVLEGNEDLLAAAVDVAVRRAGSGSAGSASGFESESSDGESDSDAEAEGKGRAKKRKLIIYYGQHWALNPAQNLLPRLPHAPIILSFRPQPTNTSSSTSTSNTNIAIHPTRSNPHAHSHVPPSPTTTDARLFILTATHEPFELDVLRGGMTAWSRANQGLKGLPAELRLQRDRAVGCVWDVKGDERERLWIYGAGWLGMLDFGATQGEQQTSKTPQKSPLAPATTSDSTTTPTTNKKRKTPDPSDALTTTNVSITEPTPAKKQKLTLPQNPTKTGLTLQKHTTGASGSRIPDVAVEKKVFGAKVLKTDASGNERWIDADAQAKKRKGKSGATVEESEEEEEEESENEESEVEVEAGTDGDELTSGSGPDNVITNGNNTNRVGSQNLEPNPYRRTHWLTNRYRPILGLIPLSSTTSSAAAADFDAALELDDEELVDHTRDTVDVDDVRNGVDMAESKKTKKPGKEKREQDKARARARGMVDGVDKGDGGIEVALVERPLWDVELPDRVAGSRE